MALRAVAAPGEAADRRLAGLALTRVDLIGIGIVGLGWILRLARYIDNRSLWGDEARLALNLRDDSFTGLVHPLAYIQAAPTGFLLAEKASLLLLGDSEYALRLVPLLAGLASLTLFLPLARRVLAPAAALVAVALYSLVEPLIYYSSEVKQYSLDVLAAVVLLLIAAPALADRRLTAPRTLALLVVGAISFWFSHASVFVAAAVWLSLVVARVAMPAGRRAGAALFALIWVASFGGAYTLVLHNATNVSNALGLGTPSAGSGGGASVLRQGWHAFAYPIGFSYTATALAAVFALIGVYALFRHAPRLALPLALVPLATAGAAVINRYPFYDRFILFLTPVVLLLVAAGIDVLRRASSREVKVAWGVATALLIAYPAGQALAHLRSWPPHEEIKPVVAQMADAWRPGDTLYVSDVAQYALRYYAECNDCRVLDGSTRATFRSFVLAARGGKTALHSLPPRLEVGRIGDLSPLSTYIGDFRRFDGRRRAWFLFTSSWVDADVALVLGCRGHQLAHYASTRAAAYLYDLAAPPDLGTGQCPGVTRGG